MGWRSQAPKSRGWVPSRSVCPRQRPFQSLMIRRSLRRGGMPDLEPRGVPARHRVRRDPDEALGCAIARHQDASIAGDEPGPHGVRGPAVPLGGNVGVSVRLVGPRCALARKRGEELRVRARRLVLRGRQGRWAQGGDQDKPEGVFRPDAGAVGEHLHENRLTAKPRLRVSAMVTHCTQLFHPRSLTIVPSCDGRHHARTRTVCRESATVIASINRSARFRQLCVPRIVRV